MSDTTIDRTSRRRFLGGAAALGLAAALPGTAGAAGTSRAAAYAPTRFQLELGGQPGVFVAGVEGGDAYGEVAVTAAPAGVSKKHVVRLRFDPITIETGLSMGQPLADWIRLSLDGRQTRMDGALTEADYDLNAIERREFGGALITQVGFPALDAASKEAALLTVKLVPETMRYGPGKGKAQSPVTKSKLWLAGNFRFELDGIDTSRVSKIDAFVIEQVVTESPGVSRDPVNQAGRIELPNLTVTFTSQDPADLRTWHEDFLLDGASGDDQEKRGAIVLLAPDLKEELGRVDLSNVGIVKLSKRTDEGLRRFSAELYVEKMDFKLTSTNA